MLIATLLDGPLVALVGYTATVLLGAVVMAANRRRWRCGCIRWPSLRQRPLMASA